MHKQYEHLDGYRAIFDYYGDRIAQRSQIPLINHIHEGLEILDSIGASDAAKEAYALHPIFQSAKDFAQNAKLASNFDSYVMLLTIEYRHCANAYLCHPGTDGLSLCQIKKRIGNLIPEVRDMLIADKRQNYKDFMLYHYGTHNRSNELYEYFNNWLKILNPTDIKIGEN